jgi:uncharacterized membrane protein YkvA (DUF1232 family)
MTPKNIEKYADRYNEQDLIKKITRAAKKAGIKVIYLALLLYYVLKSPKVKMADKGKIWGALGYFILPIEIIPDFIPIVGYTDDLAALMWAFYSVAKNVTPEIEAQAKKKLHDWFGDYDEKDIIIGKAPEGYDGDVDVQG